MPFFKSNKKKNTKKDVVKNSSRKKFDPRSKAEKRLLRDVEESSSDEDIPTAKKFKESEIVEDTETAFEKKERLATQYVEELKALNKIEDDSGQDHLNLRKHLQDEILSATDNLFTRIAHKLKDPSTFKISTFKCKKFQRKTITCVVVSKVDDSIYSSSWDGSIVKYSSSGKVVGVIRSSHQSQNKLYPAHKKEVYSLAVSDNGKYLVSGDGEGVMHVWNADTLQHVEKFHRHRKAVTGLTFQAKTLNLYSCSLDRMVMEWNLEDMVFVDNLGGHSVGVQGIDSLQRQSCISCGGHDETVSIYAIEDDKQFQFSTKQMSIDGVKLVNENTFLTHGMDGSICLWATSRKRPVQQLHAAHGYREGSGEPHWITALAALPNSDLVASGSSDGFIRIWRVDNIQARKLLSVCRVPIAKGVVNSLAFVPSGNALIVGLARTHKLGRWFVQKSPNCVVKIEFSEEVLKTPESKLNVMRNLSNLNGDGMEKQMNGEEEMSTDDDSDKEINGGAEEEEDDDDERESGEDENVAEDDDESESGEDDCVAKEDHESEAEDESVTEEEEDESTAEEEDESAAEEEDESVTEEEEDESTAEEEDESAAEEEDESAAEEEDESAAEEEDESAAEEGESAAEEGESAAEEEDESAAEEKDESAAEEEDESAAEEEDESAVEKEAEDESEEDSDDSSDDDVISFKNPTKLIKKQK